MPVLAGLLFASVAACGKVEADQITLVTISNGTYRAAFGQGYLPTDESKVLAVSATLDRATGRLVFTMANGSQQIRTLSFRPKSQWNADCYTMSSHTLNEVADLSPAPLRIESMSFATPVVYPKCSAQRLILSAAPGDQTSFIAFDLQ
jgi:hypothetical protein